MRFVNFSVTRRNISPRENRNANDTLFDEPMHVVNTDVYIKKTGENFWDPIDMAAFLIVSTAGSFIMTTVFGFGLSNWWFLAAVFDILAIIGYATENTSIIVVYVALMISYAVAAVNLHIAIVFIGAPETSEFFKSRNFKELARFSRDWQAAVSLVLAFIIMILRIVFSCKYIEHITLTKLLAKLRSQKFVLRASC